jgi:hypothetical protein
MGSTKHLGDCRLCGVKGVPLNDSHILPKWTYRRATDSTRALGFADPVHSNGQNSFTTSFQVKEYLLCDACEGLLGKDENFVSRLAGKDDGRLGLLDLVTTGPAPLPNYQAARLSGPDAEATLRFAASVFWRASVSKMKECGGLRLWKEASLALARFVRGLRPWPQDMCLLFFGVVGEDGEPSEHGRTSAFPQTYRAGEHGWHQFIASGLVFTLAMGDKVAAERRISLNGPEPHVLLCTWQRIRFMVGLTNSLMAAEPRGRLANVREDLRRRTSR